VNTILVVDDSATIRRQVRDAMMSAGYDVLEAVDGQDGLQKLRANPGLVLVLCDINMPNLNGLEMVASASAEQLVVPIVMLTSEGQPSLIRKSREAGAKGWIVKPFKRELLVAAVNKLAIRLPKNI
jgi:two-component system chemotaxis response regulator CheY